ncbi:MAG: tetratricopeptide repeat protein [Myxococcota bacterium]
MDQTRTLRIGSTRGTLQTLGLMTAFCLMAIVLTGGRIVDGAILGGGLFLIYRIGVVRMILCRHHRDGVGRSRDGDFPGALEAFRRSEADWQTRGWLDQRRGWLLGSASRWPFHALALYNQGFCLARMGQPAQAAAVLDDALHRYPDMRLARQLREAMRDAPALQPGGWDDLLSGEPG